MITILPLKDQERLNQICNEIPELAEKHAVLEMSSGYEKVGYLIIDIKSSVIRMHKMYLNEQDNLDLSNSEVKMCADSFMRAAASYGANNGAYKIQSLIPQLNPYYKALGFELENNTASTDLSNIIKISKK